jgi:hypothetical protein
MISGGSYLKDDQSALGGDALPICTAAIAE